MAKKTIVICSSASFYEHVNQIARQLEKRGYKVKVPTTAKRMHKDGSYDVARVKIWLKEPSHFIKKQALARGHFDEVAKCDGILIVNDDKPGRPNYIGPNTTMEWGLAWYLKKPVFILKGVGKDSNFYEEVYGMSTTVLDGDLTKIKF